MAELTKQALKVANNTEFPNNNNGQITPTRLRTFNEDMIDSLVDEISYTADSASFNNRINSVTGSSAITASSLITASFDNGTRNLTFTKGNNTQFSVNIPDVSGSTGNFATTGSNTFVGDQTISGSVLPLVNGQGDLGTDSQRWNSVNVNGQLKGGSVNVVGRSSMGPIRFLDETLPLNFLSDRELIGNGTGADTHLYYGTSSVNLNALREIAYVQSGSNANMDGRFGGLATTGSNSFIGNQTIAGGLLVSSSAAANGFSGSTFRVDTTGTITFKPGTAIDFQGNTNFTAPIRTTIVNVDNSGSNGYYGFNAETEGRIYQDFSGSVNARINAITGSGGSINTGSFATTGSNTFTGNQTISTAGNTQLNIISTGGGQANVEFQAPNANFQAYGDFRINNNGQYGGSGSIFVVAKDNSIAFAADRGFQFGSVNSVGSSIEGGFVTINVPSGSSQLQLTGSMLVTNNLTVSGNANVNTDLTVVGNTNVGNVNVADAGGINFACTGSGPVTSYGMVTNPANGDLVFNNNPGNGRLMTFRQTDARAQIYGGLYLNGIEGAGGVNMNTLSGSLFLTPNGFNFDTASLTHVATNNIANNVNLIFKNNNNTASTILSGSANIFVNQAASTAGFVRYMTGGNIAVGGNGAASPQVTGSAAFSPTIANNYFGVSATPLLYRGPVSSSAVTINNNVLAGGQVIFGNSAANNFERAVSGLTFSNNVVNGAINAGAFKTPLSASFAMQSCNIGGTTTLNADSSSIQFNGTIQQGSLTINNSYFPSTYNATSAILSFAASAYIGLGNSIFASGSNVTFTTPRTIISSGMLGANNTFSASLNGDNTQIHSTYLLGQSLIALGTNTRPVGATGADWGSVYVGRWNAIDGTKDQTAETIFAVGTGTGTATRKTGFLIDSGSNSFFEGTLNVSGSTTLSGSLSIQSGSTFFANGNKQYNVGTFQSDVTQSGSANVSQSMNFEVTDISEGVSIASNSRITLANAGTYNIQFSVQVDRVSGSGTDTVHIWLKKNGTNVDKSAGAITIAGSAAQAKTIAAWNYVVNAAANDYYELCWQSTDANIQLVNQAATGNIPSTPSIILTVTQVR